MKKNDFKINSYLLTDNKEVKRCSENEFLKWIKENKYWKVVEKSIVGNYLVSTVFLSIDHNFLSIYEQDEKNYRPLIFETMIFDKENNNCFDYEERYRSWDEAIEGHNRAIKFCLNIKE